MVDTVEDRARCRTDFPRAKGADRIHINNFMGAVIVGVLTVLLTLKETTFSLWTIGQLAISIPFFFTSSLAYSKICYRDPKEYPIWDALGWFTHTVGYLATLNAVVVLLYLSSPYRAVALMLLATTFFLFAAYSIMDVVLDRMRLWEKVCKFGFYMLLIGLGSIVPIIIR